MKRITLESYRNNPQLSPGPVASARRERAQAMQKLVAGLVHRLTPRLHLGPWIARLG